MTQRATHVIAADLTWTGDRFEADVQVAVGASGRIERVGALGLPATRRLTGRALLPGFVNAHSHAFQRALRGRGERFPEWAETGAGAGTGAGSFWTWREAMYELVASLDAERFRGMCVDAYREMLSRGITTVGEFHYVHHAEDGAAWPLDRVVLEAAREAGIRLVLLNAYYRTGGIGRPLEGAQQRFDGGSVAAYWAQMDRLAHMIDPATQSLGAVAHSVRAVSLDDLRAVYNEAKRRGLPFHMHLEEQRQEIAECVAAYACRPMELVARHLGVTGGFTAVHCTHSDEGDLERFLQAGGSVCVCPLTEANLGDGIPDIALPHAAGGRLCLGTDSNVRISMLEEMRWLEYGQRLKTERRGVLVDEEGMVARTLLDAATVNGARALGVEAGRIAAGRWADFVAIDLGAAALGRWDDTYLLDALVFGVGDEVIAETCVGGRWREE